MSCRLFDLVLLLEGVCVSRRPGHCNRRGDFFHAGAKATCANSSEPLVFFSGRLINDIKRLQTQCSKYEPTILEVAYLSLLLDPFIPFGLMGVVALRPYACLRRTMSCILCDPSPPFPSLHSPMRKRALRDG